MPFFVDFFCRKELSPLAKEPVLKFTKIEDKSTFRAPVKNTVFLGPSPILMKDIGSVLGAPGERLPGGKSGFRLGGVAKSTKIEEKSMKIGSRGRPESDFRVPR